MKRNHADGAVAVLVAFVLLTGGFATWQAYQQWSALGQMGDHMGTSVTAMHGTHPVWYLLGTILVAGVLSGGYVAVRHRIVPPDDQPTESDTAESGSGASDQSEKSDPDESTVAETEPTRPILDLLPDDERRILQPVIESPGLTQIELRDRSAFSKSKVSQTVTELEKRGLLYREPQGRTYRVYPSDELGRKRDRSVSPE